MLGWARTLVWIVGIVGRIVTALVASLHQGRWARTIVRWLLVVRVGREWNVGIMVAVWLLLLGTIGWSIGRGRWWWWRMLWLRRMIVRVRRWCMPSITG